MSFRIDKLQLLALQHCPVVAKVFANAQLGMCKSSCGRFKIFIKLKKTCYIMIVDV